MRHLLLTCLGAAILGVITSIGVAWTCSLWIDLDLSQPAIERGLFPSEPPQWRVFVWEQSGAAHVRSGEALFPGLGREQAAERVPIWSRAASHPSEPPELAIDLQELWLVEEGRGWPFPAMKWTANFNPRGRSGPVDEDVRAGYVIDHRTPTGDPRVLPLMPNGSEFTYSSGLYGGIWLLIITVPFAVRRWIRWTRRWCLSCGYDLRGSVSERCPECGTKNALVRKKQSRDDQVNGS